MCITVDQLKEKVLSEIEATHVVNIFAKSSYGQVLQPLQTTEVCVEEFVDTSDGCGAKFTALIVAPQFEGMPLIKRHRMVHAAIEAEMKEIHALQIKALTPEQWEKQKP